MAYGSKNGSMDMNGGMHGLKGKTPSDQGMKVGVGARKKAGGMDATKGDYSAKPKGKKY
jgi:hypothetical protein